MADPLSIAASIASLLTISIQSCRYISNFFTQVSSAPAEVSFYRLCFQALHATFSELQIIFTDCSLVGVVLFPPGFDHRLESCKKDLEAVQAIINDMEQKMKGTRMRRTWASINNTLFTHERLEKFSNRLQQYQALFTLDLITINTKLALHSSKQLTQTSAQTQQFSEKRQTFNACKTTTEKPVFFRQSSGSRRLCTYTSNIGSLAIYKMPATSQHFNGIRLQLRVRIGPWKKSACISFFPERVGMSMSFSARCTLTLPPVLPSNSQIFGYVRAGNVRVIQSMFQLHRATPLDTTPDGASLLHMASRKCHLELVEILLRCGADVNATDDFGRTPLHWAMEGPKNFEVCRALLKSGADITSQDIEDKTPLHTFFNNSVSSILLNHRDLVEEQVFDCYGMNILHFAAWSSSSTPAHFSRFVKEEPYLCDAPDHEGRTLIHFASERGNIALLEYLCTISNANIAPQDAKGRTPIHYAVRSKRLHSLDLLVSRGADINAVTGRGWTVLHEAVARDNVAAINRIIALLGSKAQSALEAVDHQGLNPLMLAKKCTARHAFEYLVTHQAKDTMMSSTFDDRAIESYMCSARVSKANRNRLISWDIIVVWEFLITLFVPLLLSLIIASIWAFMVRKTIL